MKNETEKEKNVDFSESAIDEEIGWVDIKKFEEDNSRKKKQRKVACLSFTLPYYILVPPGSSKRVMNQRQTRFVGWKTSFNF